MNEQLHQELYDKLKEECHDPTNLYRWILKRFGARNTRQTQSQVKEPEYLTDEMIQDHMIMNCRNDHGEPIMDEHTFFKGAKWARDQQPNCIFETSTDTSSATICKHCGREKWEHQQPTPVVSEEELRINAHKGLEEEWTQIERIRFVDGFFACHEWVQSRPQQKGVGYHDVDEFYEDEPEQANDDDRNIKGYVLAEDAIIAIQEFALGQDRVDIDGFIDNMKSLARPLPQANEVSESEIDNLADIIASTYEPDNTDPCDAAYYEGVKQGAIDALSQQNPEKGETK
jgi:hypothetical protein